MGRWASIASSGETDNGDKPVHHVAPVLASPDHLQRLWEREAAFEALSELLQAAREGRGSALFLIGESGLGKSALVDEARRQGEEDFLVGVGRGRVMEESVPFGLIHQAFAGLLEPGGEELDPDDLIRAAIHGPDGAYELLRAVRTAARRGPMLLIFDDLQWADPSSLHVLSYVCRRVADEGIAVVGALRPWPPAAMQLCGTLLEEGVAKVHRLAPLSEPGVEQWMTIHRGSTVPPPLVRRVWSLTGGNPLLLGHLHLEIPRSDLVSTGKGSSMEHSDEFIRLAPFGPLSSQALRSAQAASIQGTRFRTALVERIAGLEEADHGLAELFGCRLIREIGPGWAEFCHPLFCEKLYREMVPSLRAQLHARAFHLCEEFGATSAAASHAIAADALVGAEAADVLCTAGREAMEAGEVGFAVRSLQRAAQLSGRRAAPELLYRLALAQWANGLIPGTIATCTRLLGGAEVRQSLQCDGTQLLGRACLLAGEYAKAEACFDDAAERASEAGDKERIVAILTDRAIVRWYTAGPAAAHLLADQAVAIAGGQFGPIGRAATVTSAFLAAQTDQPEIAQEFLRVQPREDRIDGELSAADRGWPWGDDWSLVQLARYTDDLTEATSAYGRAQAKAERGRSIHQLVTLALAHSETLMRMGDLRQAVSLVEGANVLASVVPAIQALAVSLHGYVLMEMGQNADACLRCDEAESLAAERHEWLPLLWTAHARAVLELANGRPRDASDRYRDLEVLARVRGVDNPLVVPWAERAVAAHLGCGRRDDARRLMDWLEHSHTQLPSPWVAVVALASRALAADAEGDVEAAAADFEEALALHQECNFPLERISTATAFASLLRRRGSPRRARELLTEALAVCEASGAALRATVVAAELTVAGGRRNVRLKRRSAAAGQNQLTAQEQRVAALAATGKTNPQIGTELYVSSRTIETHLKHIYEKLSIRSRHELMALVLSRQRHS